MKNSPRHSLRLAALLALSMGAASSAWASSFAPESPRSAEPGQAGATKRIFHAAKPVELQLSAEASVEVQTDELTVTLGHEVEGPAAAPLNAQVLKLLNEGLSQAKRYPGIEARLANVHTFPTYGPDGKRKSWRVRGEIVLKSKDTVALGELSGSLSERLQLQGVNYSVSPELAKKTREALIADAAAAFRGKALATAQALGFADVAIASIQLVDGVHHAPPMHFKGRAEMSSMAAADMRGLPSDGGKERVSVTFSGVVHLKR